jgi:hypothetical protein
VVDRFKQLLLPNSGANGLAHEWRVHLLCVICHWSTQNTLASCLSRS